MPQAVAIWVFEAIAAAGTAAGVTATVVSIAAVVGAVIAYVGVTISIGLAVGAVARAIGLGGAKLPTGSLTAGSPLQLSRDPVASRRVIYGRTRVSGTMVYAQVAGPKNEYFHMVIAQATHECEAIEDVYFTDDVVPLDGSGNAYTSPYVGNARVEKFLGTDTQAALSDLVSDSGGMWTTNHRLRGIAGLYIRLLFDQSKFPGGIPSPSSVIKGCKVLDPRDGVTRWTDNPALCIRDYLVAPTFGLAVDSATEIDDASFIAAANICDEAVSLAAGGAEKRYTLNGCFDLSADPATVLQQMCAAMAGFVVYIGGKWVCHAGAHQTPTITLDENDLRGPIGVQTKQSMRDTCNGVKGTFPSPDDQWQPTDFTPITSKVAAANLGAGIPYVISFVGTTDFTAVGAASNNVGVMFAASGPGTGTGYANLYLAEDGGVEIWRDLSLAFTTSQSTCQRLAKIELESTRQDIAVTAPCKLTALRAQAGDVIMLSNTRFGWTGKMFLVTGLKFSSYDAGGTPALGVDLTLRETAAEVWDWNNGEETTYDPAPNTNLLDPRAVAVPTGLSLSTSNFRQADGTITPRLHVVWDAPADQFVLSGGWELMEYKKHADSDWISWARHPGNFRADFITDVLGGVSYDVRLRFQNVFGSLGDYATATATVGLDTTAPGDITGLTATAQAEAIWLQWTNPADSDFAGTEIFENTVSVFGTATSLGVIAGTGFLRGGLTAGDTLYFWAIGRDTSNNPSVAAAGPVSAAALAAPTGAPGADGSNGSNGADAKLVVLTSDAQAFQYPKAGGTNPSSITFTATGQNLSGSPTFSVSAGTATLTGSGTTRALAPAGMSTDAITVKVVWDGQTDYLSVVKVREGLDGTNGTNGSDGVAIKATTNGSSTVTVSGDTTTGISVTTATGTLANVMFSGNFTVNGATSSNYIVSVYSDGVSIGTFNTGVLAGSATLGVTIMVTPTLTAGSHTFALHVIGFPQSVTLAGTLTIQ